MLSPGIFDRLGPQHGKGPCNAHSGGMRHDHIVNIASFTCDEGI